MQPGALPLGRPHQRVAVGGGDRDVAGDVAENEASLRGAPLTAVIAWNDFLVDSACHSRFTVDWAEVEQVRVPAERLAGRQEKYPDVRVHRAIVHDRPVRALALAGQGPDAPGPPTDWPGPAGRVRAAGIRGLRAEGPRARRTRPRSSPPEPGAGHRGGEGGRQDRGGSEAVADREPAADVVSPRAV
ncbi:hypothetical protein [Saccharothrix algeriensis]|uniref:Uncharacterized protein n=1 Tax=Saccharothrix algeriensis TaxID=173560 RepID=A0ABS2SG83_9PSEU|nr:hypothetical protein [Saccharothrix algeriensis]MBM7814634.1 hypothetical protein [Saccharothrix algeriensis]